MAEKRMFAKGIIDSDMFLDMPPTSQNLYFHLGMRADDEGFINNAKRIMRDVRASDSDMRTLIQNQYIIPFDSGVIVITHWRLHNWIRKERIHPTSCEAEKALLEMDGTGKYRLKNSDVSQLSDTCQTNVSQVSDVRQTNVSQVPDKCQLSIDKNSIDKNSSSIARVRAYHDNDEMSSIFHFYEENFSTISGFTAEVLEGLQAAYSSEWVMQAMKTCAKAGRQKCNIKYLEGVLKGWKADGGAKPWEQSSKAESEAKKKFEEEKKAYRREVKWY